MNIYVHIHVRENRYIHKCEKESVHLYERKGGDYITFIYAEFFIHNIKMCGSCTIW